MKKAAAISLAPLGLTLFLACGGGGVGPNGALVGAICSNNAQCQSTCDTSHDFDRGMCTFPCRIDNDCPGGTVCVDTSGGICAVACANPNDCADFGPNWTCGAEGHTIGGQTLVCRVP